MLSRPPRFSGGRAGEGGQTLHSTPTRERMHHIDWGLGVFRREAFDLAPDGVQYDLATLYQRLLAAGRLAAFEVDRRFYEIGSLEGIAEMRAMMRARAAGAPAVQVDGHGFVEV